MPLQKHQKPLPPQPNHSEPFVGQTSQSAPLSREPSLHRDGHLENGSQLRGRNDNAPISQGQRKREYAAALKMEVPNTIEPSNLKHQVSRSTSDDGERSESRQDQARAFALGSENRNFFADAPAPDRDDTSMWNLSYPEEIDAEPPVEQTVVFKPTHNLSIELGPHWQSEAAIARQRSAHLPGFGSFATHQNRPFGSYVNHQDDEDDQDDNITEEINDEFQMLQNNTPSRINNVHSRGQNGATKPEIKLKKATFANVSVDDQNSAFPASQETVVETASANETIGKRLAQDKETKQSNKSSKAVALLPTRGHSNKIASYPDSSSEDEQVPISTEQIAPAEQEANTNPFKRPHDALDYSPDTLKGKKFDDLSSIPFLTDPRDPPGEPAIDATGKPMSLAAKLTNLSKMRPEDQATLFRTLTDAENSETGEWFMNKFAEDLKRLTQVRLERRKITLDFEMETQKREALVKQKTQAVDQELMGLKKGGGDLIRGRSPGIVTPRKV